MLHRVDPIASPYSPSDNPVENVKDAFEDAGKKYGVPMLIDADDPNYWKVGIYKLRDGVTFYGNILAFYRVSFSSRRAVEITVESM